MQKVTVVTDGTVELSKADAVKSLGSSAERFVVVDWTKEGAAAETTAAEPEDEGMAKSLLAESQEWTNAQGATITAAVQKVESGMVYFLMPDGKVIPYEVSKLSQDTIDRLKTIMAAAQ